MFLFRGAVAASCFAHIVAFAPEDHYTFDAFVKEFGRDYTKGSEEHAARKSLFDEKLRAIRAHNADRTKSWTAGVNKFTDLSDTEFGTRLGSNRQLARHFAAHAPPVAPLKAVKQQFPRELDWRTKGVVSPVKDQGQCGSCWAFGTTETIESHAALASPYGAIPTLSPQQLTSCAPNPLHCGGTGGCEGSIPEVAYDYVQLYGMTTEWMYPYTSYFGGNGECHFNASKTGPQQVDVRISGYQKLTPNDLDAVMDALVNVGPLAINVDASTWHSYDHGVYDGCNRTNVDLDHVVQLVGYGTDAHDGDYWLVRNSWDMTWGEGGYIRLKRDHTPTCGTDSTPLDGTGCANDGSDSQHVCGSCGMLFDVSYPLGAEVVWHGHHGHPTSAVVV